MDADGERDEDYPAVSETDPRNAALIEVFRPRRLTAALIRASLAPYYANRPEAALSQKVQEVAANAMRTPAPQLWAPFDAVVDPFHTLGTHPEIVAALLRLDAALPRRCRVVFWGKPTLVHPDTGVVFAVGYGNIAVIMRLPRAILAAGPPDECNVVFQRKGGRRFDISGAGPGWRFVRPPISLDWGGAAYEFAGEAN